MIGVQFSLHLGDKKSLFSSKFLNACKNFLWPIQLIVIGNDDHPISFVADSFNAPFDK